MPCSLKTLLLYFLLLALPVQGFAAVTRLSCSSDHRWMNGTAVASLATVAAAPDRHHQDVHEASASGADSHVEQGMAGHPHDQSAHSSCSACAACCIGVAVLPSATYVVKPATVSFAPPAMPDPLFASHFPASPERPPRAISA